MFELCNILEHLLCISYIKISIKKKLALINDSLM